MEKLICINEELSELDKNLAFLYRRILDSLDFASETIEKDRIQAEQRKWLKKERNICADAACLRLEYEARSRQLEGERDFSDLASDMTSIYNTSLSVASEVDAQRIRAEQNKWQKAVRDSCKNAACLCSAYSARSKQLKKEAEQDIHQYWETDGYWYFYTKNKQGSPPSAFFAHDGSDVLLEPGAGWTIGNIWINAHRFATQEEMDKTIDMSSGSPSHEPKPLCNGNTVEVMDNGSNANFGNPINRVVIRTPQQADDYWCEECRSFAIFGKQDPPRILEKVLIEDHQEPGVPLLIPIESEIYNVEVLSDCTIIAKIDEGVVRFRADGTTDAELPPGMRLVDGKQVVRWENEFLQSFKGMSYLSLQPKLWLFYHKIFKGENQ